MSEDFRNKKLRKLIDDWFVKVAIVGNFNFKKYECGSVLIFKNELSYE
jgi:hypothetical protein